MTIRTRLTLWYAGVFCISAIIISVAAWNELHEEPEPDEPPDPSEGWPEVAQMAAWIGLPTILLSVGGGWVLMHKAMKPVAALAQSAAQINEHNLQSPLPRTRNGDEIDQLTGVLNSMNARLHESFLQIREFTLNASHELKTPLTVLCAESESELVDTTLSAEQRERAESRLQELRRLAWIVDSLTLLARADAGQLKLRQEPVQFDELVRDGFADLQVLAGQAQITPTLTACEEVKVMGDSHRLRQLLLNLADNAVKYNIAGGTVSVSLRNREGHAEFSIANTGPGVPPQHIPKVFDRFFRGDISHNSEIEGSGLGLSIAQWIVHAHGGEITLESDPKVTTVRVKLRALTPKV